MQSVGMVLQYSLRVVTLNITLGFLFLFPSGFFLTFISLYRSEFFAKRISSKMYLLLRIKTERNQNNIILTLLYHVSVLVIL